DPPPLQVEERGGRRSRRVGRRLDGGGEAVEELEVAGRADLVGEGAEHRIAARARLRARGDAAEQPGKRGLEMAVLGGVGGELGGVELTPLPAAVEGMVEEAAAGDDGGQLALEELAVHVSLPRRHRWRLRGSIAATSSGAASAPRSGRRARAAPPGRRTAIPAARPPAPPPDGAPVPRGAPPAPAARADRRPPRSPATRSPPGPPEGWARCAAAGWARPRPRPPEGCGRRCRASGW